LPQYSRPGAGPPWKRGVADASVRSLRQMMDYAHAAQMPLAIEPFIRPIPRPRLPSTPQSMRLIFAIPDPQRSGAPACADFYHILWDPDSASGSCARRKDRLLAFMSATGWCRQGHSQRPRHDGSTGVSIIRSCGGAVEAQGFAVYSEIEHFCPTPGGQTDRCSCLQPASRGTVGGLGSGPIWTRNGTIRDQSALPARWCRDACCRIAPEAGEIVSWEKDMDRRTIPAHLGRLLIDPALAHHVMGGRVPWTFADALCPVLPPQSWTRSLAAIVAVRAGFAHRAGSLLRCGFVVSWSPALLCTWRA